MKENKKKDSVKRQAVGYVIVIAVALLIAFLLGQFVLLDAKVRSNYMEGTLSQNNRVIAARLSYTFSEPERGDVVVVKDPIDDARNKKTEYVKRIVGLPGETVTIENGKVSINGAVLEESYITESWTMNNGKYTFTVPEGKYFVLGDNRNETYDSRSWAQTALSEGVAKDAEDAVQYSFVSKKQISGKVFLRYWPLNKIAFVK